MLAHFEASGRRRHPSPNCSPSPPSKVVPAAAKPAAREIPQPNYERPIWLLCRGSASLERHRHGTLTHVIWPIAVRAWAAAETTL